MTYDPVYMAEWRAKNPEKLRQYRERWNAAHPGRALELGRHGYAVNKPERQARARENYAASQEHFVSKMRQRVAKDPALYLWKRAKNRAEKRGVAFDITPADILVPIFCPVLGLRLERGRGRFNPTSPTLDRIDNTRGYVKGNIIVVCWRANRLKSDASLPELRAILEFYEALT